MPHGVPVSKLRALVRRRVAETETPKNREGAKRSGESDLGLADGAWRVPSRVTLVGLFRAGLRSKRRGAKTFYREFTAFLPCSPASFGISRDP